MDRRNRTIFWPMKLKTNAALLEFVEVKKYRFRWSQLNSITFQRARQKLWQIIFKLIDRNDTKHLRKHLAKCISLSFCLSDSKIRQIVVGFRLCTCGDNVRKFVVNYCRIIKKNRRQFQKFVPWNLVRFVQSNLRNIFMLLTFPNRTFIECRAKFTIATKLSNLWH